MEFCNDCNRTVRESCGFGVEMCNNMDTPEGRTSLLVGFEILKRMGIDPIPDTVSEITDPDE